MKLFISLLLSLCCYIAISKKSPRRPGNTQIEKKPPLVVLITGCSSGIGKSTAIEFSKSDKYIVWATMRSTSVWDVPARDNLRTAVMDVTSEDSINSVVQNIIETDGKIDIVVNNAGYGVVGTVESVKLSEAKVSVSFFCPLDPEILQDVFDVNFWGVVRVLQAGKSVYH